MRPKPPDVWLQTVNRMVDRAVIGRPIDQEERRHVAAYLATISPDLQQGVAAKRQQELEIRARSIPPPQLSLLS